MENGELQMRDGWSDYHRAQFEREIERLQKKIAVLKLDIIKWSRPESGKVTATNCE